jgi:hypothetical protein
MLLSPSLPGAYTITLAYHTDKLILLGAVISVASLLGLSLAFLFRRPLLVLLGRLKKRWGIPDPDSLEGTR